MNRSLNEEGDLNGSKLYVFNMYYLNLNTSYVINKKLFLIRKILCPKKNNNQKLKCKEINSIFVSLTSLPQKDKNLTGKEIEIIDSDGSGKSKNFSIFQMFYFH